MKQKIILFLALTFASFTYGQTVDEIVNHHIDAMGGKAKLDKLKSLRMTGSIVVGPNMKAPFTISLKDKTKMRFEMEIQGMKMMTALTGDSGWKVVPFTGKTDPERMSAEEIKDAKDQADFTTELYNYKEKGSTVELVDKEDMEGTDVYKLKVTKKTGDIVYLFLDASSYLELKQTSIIKMADKEIKSSALQSNYKDVDGYKFAFTMEMRGENGDEPGQVMTFDKIEINPDIDEKIFDMPPVTSAVKSPATEEKK